MARLIFPLGTLLVLVAQLSLAAVPRPVSRMLARVNRGAQGKATVSFVTSHRVDKAVFVEKYRLSNGLVVLVMADRSAPVFAYQTWFKVGSRHERRGKTGIAHLFEHLLFKATTHLKDGEFDKIMERNGAVTNAATWLDWTYYLQNLPSGKLPLVTRLEADRMENMILNQRQLDSERKVVMNERRLRVDNDPDGKLSEVLYQTAFTHHKYGWPTIGWMADIRAITLKDCIDFYRTYYSPNAATIVIVGDVKIEEALKLIVAHYGHLKAQRIPREVQLVEPRQTVARRKQITLAVSAPKLVLGYHGPALTSPDHAVAEVINEVLFGGRSGRVRKHLIQDTEVASSVTGWLSPFKYPGLFEIWVSLKKGKRVDAVERLLEQQLSRLRTQGITARELTKAKNRLEIAFLRGLSTVGHRARQLGHYETTTGDFRKMFEVLKRYRQVTRRDVLRVARRLFAPGNRTVIVGLPRATTPREGKK